MSTASIELPGEGERLRDIIAFLQEFWRAEGLQEEESLSFELSVEELFMNVSMHGTADVATPPRVSVSLSRDGDQVELVFRDQGQRFDPLSLPPPDLSDDIDSVKVGGLGIFLLREMMDEVEYRFEDGWNCLRIAKRVAAA